MAQVYIGLGANLGDRAAYINNAIDILISNPAITLKHKSSLSETKPVDYADQPDFLNQIIQIETDLSPDELLSVIKEVEKKTGRKKSFPKGPREIDLDILLYDNLCYKNNELEIPHPGIIKRKFILEHLTELDETLTEPGTGKLYMDYVQDQNILTMKDTKKKEATMPAISNINDFKKYKEEQKLISIITCYDHAIARIIEQTDIDVILVGDSVGMVQAGFASTIPVTMDQMIYHASIVRKGAPSKFIVADMPFMSYHVSPEDSMRNAGRMMQETGANAIKLEGGEDFTHIVSKLVKASIPVMGHLGLTPQSVHKLGGYSVQGKSETQRKQIIEDAHRLEDAGAFALVLEMVPESLAQEISQKLSIPIIGIGAGRYCDGQVLVINDMLGLDERFNPKFLKKYANLFQVVKEALGQYDADVKKKAFPEENNVFK